jgi:hypothetical protein
LPYWYRQPTRLEVAYWLLVDESDLLPRLRLQLAACPELRNTAEIRAAAAYSATSPEAVAALEIPD